MAFWFTFGYLTNQSIDLSNLKRTWERILNVIEKVKTQLLLKITINSLSLIHFTNIRLQPYELQYFLIIPFGKTDIFYYNPNSLKLRIY